MQREIRLFKVGRVWHYRFQIDGRRIQRTTREYLLGKAHQVAEDALQGAKLRARGEEPEPTLGGLAALWVAAHAPVLSPARVKQVETFSRLHFETIKELPLRALSTERVETARAIYLQAHARQSANAWLGCLRALLGWAIKRRMIRQVPWQVKPLRIQSKPKVLLPTRKSASWIAMVEQLTAGEPGIGLVVRLMIGLGLRVSEALDARWEWLDLERNTYTPGKTKGLEAWPRPVPPWLLGQLKLQAKLMGGIVPVRPGHPITDARVSYLMNKANKACGVLHVTPHRLRGTYATWLSEVDVPIQDIQRALGHKDIRTTLRYLEVDMTRVANAQIFLGDRLGLNGRGNGEPPNQDPHEP